MTKVVEDIVCAPPAAGVEEKLMPMCVLEAALDIILIRIMTELAVQNFFRVDLEFLSSFSLVRFQLY